MLAGHVKGQKRSLSSMFEAVGAHAAGTMTEEDVREFEEKTCPTCGSCSGMYTANSMNCLTEALGMGLKGNGTIPAVYSEFSSNSHSSPMDIVPAATLPTASNMEERLLFSPFTCPASIGPPEETERFRRYIQKEFVWQSMRA